MTLREEVTALLQELIRLDTVNPPGNETRAAELLRDYLAESGVEAQVYAKVPERANLVARLPGGDGPVLALICHTDTVLADPVEWQRDPWGGELVDGEVWGRGALDMKGHVAAAAVAFASLAREGFEPAGDLIFAATADEEVGAGFGLEWLVQQHPEAVRCDFAINEGGGERVVLGGRAVYLCATAEKMTAPFKLLVRGRSGHASMPAIADNALVRAAGLVTALGNLQPPRELIPEVSAFLEALLGGEAPAVDDALERARALDPRAGELVEPLLSTTVAPTMIGASDKRNVIPSLCEVTVDCRILPGRSPEDVEPVIRNALGDGAYELEWIERWGGTRSDPSSALWTAIEGFVAELEPSAAVVPICTAGFTDSHWLRDAFGTVAYGFLPARAMPAELTARLIHSADERVPVADLELGVDFLRHVSRVLLTA